MDIFAVEYTYDRSRGDDLAAFRPEHREYLRGLYIAGKLLASGPTDNGGALLIVRATHADEALELLTADPLHREGIILERGAFGWNPVISPWQD